MLGSILTLVLAQAAPQHVGSGRFDARNYSIAYVVTTAMTVREAPSPTAKEVGRLKRFDLPRVIEAQTGWAHVLYVPPIDSGAKEYDGWINVPQADAKDHLSDALEASLRIVAVQESRWSASVQNSVAMGRTRPGFTKEQAKATHRSLRNINGDPFSIQTTETAAGVLEEWHYAGQLLRFSGGRVVEIVSRER